VNKDKMAVIHFAEAGRHISSVAKRLKREMPEKKPQMVVIAGRIWYSIENKSQQRS